MDISIERRDLQRQIDALLAKPSLTHSERKQCDLLMSKAANLRSDDERRARVAAMAKESGLPNDEEQAVKEVRDYLKYGREARTYSGLSVAVDGSGGYFVPQPFFYKVTAMLKAIDPMFDESLVTFYESEDGNAIPAPLIADETVSATIVGEGVSATPSTINAGSLFLAPRHQRGGPAV